MDEWITLTEYNWAYWIAGGFALLEFFKWIWASGEWIVSKLGIETKNMRTKREYNERLKKAEDAIQDIREVSKNNVQMFTEHENNLSDKLERLTKMFVGKEINDYRWEIINFATRVSEGKHCNKESYKHCFKTYSDYEELLEQNDLENGEVEVNMEIIREGYKQAMLNGFE